MNKKVRSTPCQSVKSSLKNGALSVTCLCCTRSDEAWVTDPNGKVIRLPEYRLVGMSRANPYPWVRSVA